MKKRKEEIDFQRKKKYPGTGEQAEKTSRREMAEGMEDGFGEGNTLACKRIHFSVEGK